MTVITLRLSELAPWYQKMGPAMNAAVKRGLIRGGMRAVQQLQMATGRAPPANPNGIGTGGAVNTGFYKRAWKMEKLSNGVRVYNAAPYAGIIENGRRPGRFPPLKVIEKWAQRRLGLSAKEAKRAAFPIAKAIAKRGLLARKVLERDEPSITQHFFEEIEIELSKAYTEYVAEGGEP